MPLIGTDEDEHQAMNFIAWIMRDTDRGEEIKVTVGNTVLHELGKVGGAGALSAFNKNRERLEKIASRKYDFQAASERGNLSITIEDLAAD